MVIPAPKSTLRARFTPSPIPTPAQRDKFNLRRSTREIENLKIQIFGAIFIVSEKVIKINALNPRKMNFSKIYR
jgi:hypothetical protein|nr:MAG TPA: hypothetical protein [Caudoviricetes sp.]